jgi:SAM-dependent methyltransferase
MTPAHHYQDEEGRKYHEVKRGIPAGALSWVARSRAEKLQRYVGREDAVFELGVGAGWNLLELECRRKIGCDVSEFLKPQLERAGIEFLLDSGGVADGEADVVICHHTLEHVLNPAETLGELRRILKASGKLLLFVPYERERRYRRFNAEEPNHHLYSWNVQTLGNLVMECGFSIQEGAVEHFGYDRFAAKLANRLRLGEFGFRLIRTIGHLLRPQWETRIVAAGRAGGI